MQPAENGRDRDTMADWQMMAMSALADLMRVGGSIPPPAHHLTHSNKRRYGHGPISRFPPGAHIRGGAMAVNGMRQDRDGGKTGYLDLSKFLSMLTGK